MGFFAKSPTPDDCQQPALLGEATAKRVVRIGERFRLSTITIKPDHSTADDYIVDTPSVTVGIGLTLRR